MEVRSKLVVSLCVCIVFIVGIWSIVDMSVEMLCILGSSCYYLRDFVFKTIIIIARNILCLFALVDLCLHGHMVISKHLSVMLLHYTFTCRRVICVHERFPVCKLGPLMSKGHLHIHAVRVVCEVCRCTACPLIF